MKIRNALVIGLAFGLLFSGCYHQEKHSFPNSRKEFGIQGLVWRTVSYYNPGIYEELYNPENNLRLVLKARNLGANYLLIKAFYNGTENGLIIGDYAEAESSLKEAIETAHAYGLGILLIPYVESREYWTNNRWKLSTVVWTETVLKWAEFAEKNHVEMFAPGMEMNLVIDEERVGKWYREILPEIRKRYSGKVVTAEHFDIERWKILDTAGSFAGYDCIGLTVFPRKEYGNVSDIRSVEDYKHYIEEEAGTIDMLSKKYNITCKLAVPLGLDYWHGSYSSQPHPGAKIIAETTPIALDVLKKHNFTGVFISHWASEPDHFNTAEVEAMLRKRWT